MAVQEPLDKEMLAVLAVILLVAITAVVAVGRVQLG